MGVLLHLALGRLSLRQQPFGDGGEDAHATGIALEHVVVVHEVGVALLDAEGAHGGGERGRRVGRQRWLHGVEQQLRVFQQALNEVPKSGEVWCEGARIFLNPQSACFNLVVARHFLNFAIEFTPQYGDSFIEYLRLQMLVGSPDASVERLWQLCINAEPNYGVLWFHCKSSVLLTTRQDDDETPP